MENLELVKSTEFDGVHFDCYCENGSDEFWATREQIGQLLDYSEPRKAIGKIHERNKERLDKFSSVVILVTEAGEREAVVYNFKGLLEICRYSNQPKADAVMDFLWEIADEIRRKGYYGGIPEQRELLSLSEMRLREQKRSNEIESAKVLQKMIETPAYALSDSDKRELTKKIAMMVGKVEVELLPVMKYYTSKQLAKELNVTEPQLMKYAAVNWMLENEGIYGQWECDAWKFNEAGRTKMYTILGKKRGRK